MPAEMLVTFHKDKILEDQERGMEARMTRIATRYANEVKRRMRDSPASGRVYRRGNVTHQASAPGEPPAPDTGALLRSVMWQVRQDKLSWFAEVGSNLGYALWLEYGAARGVRGASGRLEAIQWILFPRPVWRPALEYLRPQFKHILGVTNE